MLPQFPSCATHLPSPGHDNIFSWSGKFEPRHEKTCLRGLRPGPTPEPDTNQSVQPQKMARDLKFRVKEVEGLYYLCSENKALLIYAFVFAYAKIRFSHDAAHILVNTRKSSPVGTTTILVLIYFFSLVLDDKKLESQNVILLVVYLIDTV